MPPAPPITAGGGPAPSRSSLPCWRKLPDDRRLVMTEPRIVSHEKWLAARKAFLAKEKEFTRLRDELSRERRTLPWERVEKAYAFAAPEGRVSVAGLFGE